MIEGIAEHLYDHGTVVSLWVRDDDGRLQTIHFDHRPFEAFINATGLKRGDRVVYDPDTLTIEVIS